jgi:4,5:9,10-diseco-3-hydroxy-5,9,17-trioxoandrosta-1(10),2-diene-4-oate hydrolase
MKAIPILGELLTRPSLKSSANNAKFLVYDPAVMTPESATLNYQMTSQPNAQQAFLKTLRENSNLLGQDKSMYSPNVRGLGRINVPVFLIWGREDKLVPMSHAAVAAQGFPNARVQILEKCGHLPMVEHPQVFNELIVSFLSQ